MLAVQQYLKNHTLDDLQDNYGIKHTISPENDLVILNYDQIASSKRKESPIVEECRQLLLENNTWNLVGKSFTRFYNWAESKKTNDIFTGATNIIYQTKHDGSIMMVFNYRNKWRLISRSSFGTAEVGKSGYNWIQLFEKIMGMNLEHLGAHLDSSRSYIFELCSTFNQVVRLYDTPIIYLLGSFSSNDLTESCDQQLDSIAKTLGVGRPDNHQIKNIADVFEYLEKISLNDKTFEGLVSKTEINPGFFHRCKFKTDSYLRLHHFAFLNPTPQKIVPLILNGEIDEIRAHPAFQNDPIINKIENKLGKYYQEVEDLWNQTKNITVQKDFAKAVVYHKLNGILFSMRKNGSSLDIEWKKAEGLLCKVLENEK